MNDVLTCAHRELIRRKGRNLANIFGYFLAVCITVAMVNVLIYAKSSESFLLGTTGTVFIVYLPACGETSTLSPEEIASLAIGIKPARCEQACKVCNSCFKKPLDIKNEGFTSQNIGSKILPIIFADEMKKRPTTIKDASPYILFRLRDPIGGYLFTLGGFDVGNKSVVPAIVCQKNNVIEGRFLEPTDTGSVLVEKAFAMSRNLSIGSIIQLAQQPFKIVGIVDPGIKPAKADVYTTFKDAEGVVNRRLRSPLINEMNVLLVEATNPDAVDPAVELAKEILQTGVVSTYACYKPAGDVLGLNEKSVMLICGILALGAMFLSMKSQLTSVIERRRDIGILKALGWTDQNIMSQIFYESVIQATLGGILGCLAAAGFVLFIPIKAVLGITSRVDPFLTPTVYLVGLLLAILGGIVAGIIPARHAARENPAEALRQS